MNHTQSCRHTFPQHLVSTLYNKPSKNGGFGTSNSDNNTYEIEISENFSEESYKSGKRVRYKKDDNPFFEAYYPSFFPESTTDASVDKNKPSRSEDRIFEVPSVATYYCETHSKPASCPKKCSHSSQPENRCQQQPSQKKVCTPKCSTHRTRNCPEKNPCERKKSECETPKIKKRSTIEFKLPPCTCEKCNDDHCDGARRRSSGTFVVSSESDCGGREKRKCCSREEDKREECPEKRVKRDSCCSFSDCQPYFQHYRDKLCGFEEKKPERQSSSYKHESCQCSKTSDRLKEISRRIEALESVYQKQQDDYDDHESRSSRHRDRKETRETRETRESQRKRRDEDRKSKKVKETSSRTSRYEDENLDTPDPDLAKTAEEIENELLEIRRRLQKLETIHQERERSKARSVQTSISNANVPVYSAMIYNPETKWRRITETGLKKDFYGTMEEPEKKNLKNKAVEVNSTELDTERIEKKENDSNQSLKENFIAVCKIVKDKLSFLIRSEKKKRKPRKSKKGKPQISSSETKISSSCTTDEKFTKTLPDDNQLFYLVPASLKGKFRNKSKTQVLYKKDVKIQQEENFPTSEFSSETPALSSLIYESDESWKKVEDENNFFFENYNSSGLNRTPNLMNYLASGDTSSNSGQSVITYNNSCLKDLNFPPDLFDFTSNKNYPFFKEKDLKCEGCQVLDPFEDLDSVKIPVLFEEVCKDVKEKHRKVFMRVVMVALENEEHVRRGPEKSEDRKKFAFGVSKCGCETKNVSDGKTSSITTSQNTKSQNRLFYASNESLKSEPTTDQIEEDLPKKPTTTRCSHCNKEYICPNAENHINPPNLIGLKRTLRDMGFVNLSEKLNDKIEFKKMIRRTKVVAATSFKKIKNKSRLSFAGRKRRKNEEESAEDGCWCQSGMPLDLVDSNDKPIRSISRELESKKYQSLEVFRQNGKKVPIITINILGDPAIVKGIDVVEDERRARGSSFEEKSEKGEKKDSRRVSPVSFKEGDDEVQSRKGSRRISPVSLKEERDDENRRKSSTRTLSVIREDPNTKSGQIEIRGESTGNVDLEIILDDQKNKSEDEMSVEVQKVTSVDSVEVHKKRRSNGKTNKKSSIASTDESVSKRITELESRLSAIEDVKNPDRSNSLPNGKSVKFSKHKNSKTVFLALLRPFKQQKITSKTKVFLKSSAEKLNKKKSEVKVFLKKSAERLHKKKSKENNAEVDDSDVDSGFIDDCSRSSPALSKRNVPLVMSSVEPIRPGKKKSKKKKKKKAEDDKAKRKKKKAKVF